MASKAGENEKLLEKVLALRQDAKLGQSELEDLGAMQSAEYRKAVEFHHVAEQFLLESRLEQAAENYKQAAWEYGKAIEASVRLGKLGRLQAKREQVDLIRASVLAANHGMFVDRLERLETKHAETLDLEQEYEQDLDTAEKLFETTLLEWKQLFQDIQDQADRQAAGLALGRLNAVRIEGAYLRNWAASFWDKADRQAAELEQAWRRQAYDQVLAGVDQVVQTYADAAATAEIQQEAEQRRLRMQQLALLATEQAETKTVAVTAWQTATTARQAALELEANTGFEADFAKAEGLLKLADQALAEGDFERAAEHFILSAEQYEQLNRRMEFRKSELLRSEVMALREKIPDHAPLSRLEQAEKMLAQAEKLLEAGDYPEANKTLKSAFNRFTKLVATVDKSARPVSSTRSVQTLTLSAAGCFAAIIFIGGYFYLSADNESESDIFASESKIEAQPKKPQPVAAQTPMNVNESVKAAPPAAIFSFHPADRQVDIAEGQARGFAVRAKNANWLNLHYAWFLDGHKQPADAAEWQYKPGFADAADKPKQLKVVISEGAKTVETKTWRIQVINVNREPKLQRLMPVKDNLELAVGETVNFSAGGSDPDVADRLDYLWLQDGQPVAKTREWKFKPVAAAQHKIAVEISDPGGLKAGKAWNVRVAPAKIVEPPRITSISPEVTAKPLRIDVTDKQVFSAKAKAEKGLSPRYKWYLDGKRIGESAEWTYLPKGTEIDGKAKEVKLVVTDSNGRGIEKVWKIMLVHRIHPPKIEKTQPDTVRLSNDDAQNFSVIDP